MEATIEYDLWVLRDMTLWHCSRCHRYRHREELAGLLAAQCCGVQMSLIDRYKQPIRRSVCGRV